MTDCVQMTVSMGTNWHSQLLGNAYQKAYPKIKKADHTQGQGRVTLGHS